MKFAFVTGAHGFIGRHLSKELFLNGFSVAGLGHGAWPEVEAAQWGISHWLNGTVDTVNLDVLRRLAHTPEVVFHLAGGASVGASLANPREDFYRTVTTSAELLEWIRQHMPSTRVILVSSAAVYGNSCQNTISESSALKPYSPYGVHKRLMEELGQSYSDNFGLSVVIARLFSVFGPDLRKQLLWDLCTKLATGASQITLGGTGHEMRDWTDVSDVVNCLIGLAGQGLEGFNVFNIGTGIGTSVREVASHVSASWQAHGGQFTELVFSGESRPGDPLTLVANCDKLQKMDLCCCQPLAKHLDSYVQWFRSLNVGGY